MAIDKRPRKWDNKFDREFFTPEEIAESDARSEAITRQLEQTDQRCPYCQPDGNGEYTLCIFENKDTGDSFTICMGYGRITIEHRKGGQHLPTRLLLPTKFCPMCGRPNGG